MIVSAATKIYLCDRQEEIIIPCHRHKDVLYILESLGYKEKEDYRRVVEGFLTDKDTFLTRRQAAEHAYECGQLIEDPEEPYIDVLFSEDLW